MVIVINWYDSLRLSILQYNTNINLHARLIVVLRHSMAIPGKLDDNFIEKNIHNNFLFVGFFNESINII